MEISRYEIRTGIRRPFSFKAREKKNPEVCDLGLITFVSNDAID